MPFGLNRGIHSIALHYSGQPAYWDRTDDHDCITCKRTVHQGRDLFVADAGYLHRLCLGVFLTTPAGRELLESDAPLNLIHTAAIKQASQRSLSNNGRRSRPASAA